jgi:hypothetical protein
MRMSQTGITLWFGDETEMSLNITYSWVWDDSQNYFPFGLHFTTIQSFKCFRDIKC